MFEPAKEQFDLPAVTMQLGYSRDQHSGNKQVCTPEGLPLSFDVFAATAPT